MTQALLLLWGSGGCLALSHEIDICRHPVYSCQGFGFIDMGGQTLFVHFSECEVGKQPKEGDILTFEYEPRNPAESLGGTGGSSNVDISKTFPYNFQFGCYYWRYE